MKQAGLTGFTMNLTLIREYVENGGWPVEDVLKVLELLHHNRERAQLLRTR